MISSRADCLLGFFQKRGRSCARVSFCDLLLLTEHSVFYGEEKHEFGVPACTRPLGAMERLCP